MKAVIKLFVVGWLCTSSIKVIADSESFSAGMPSMPGATNCTLSVSSPVIDYGTQSRWQLQEALGRQMVTPGKRTFTVSVTCPHKRMLRFIIRGERAANGDLRYGKRGSISMRASEGQLDGHDVQFATGTPDGVLSSPLASSLRIQPQNIFGVAENGRLGRGKSLTFRVEIEPILPESASRVSVRQQHSSEFKLELMVE